MKHTKGPWILKNNNPLDLHIRLGEKGKVICEVTTSGLIADYDEEEANARLIAAAPDLLRALVTCWNSLQTYGDHWLIKQQVESVLNLVKGEPKAQGCDATGDASSTTAD